MRLGARFVPTDPKEMDQEDPGQHPAVVFRRKGKAEGQTNEGDPPAVCQRAPVRVRGQGHEERDRDIEAREMTVIEDARHQCEGQCRKERALPAHDRSAPGVDQPKQKACGEHAGKAERE